MLAAVDPVVGVLGAALITMVGGVLVAVIQSRNAIQSQLRNGVKTMLDAIHGDVAKLIRWQGSVDEALTTVEAGLRDVRARLDEQQSSEERQRWSQMEADLVELREQLKSLQGGKDVGLQTGD